MLPKLRLMVERWKYNPQYNVYVSTEGRIRDHDRQNVHLLVNNRGYMVIFGPNGSQVLVHRLVLSTWCPKPDENMLTVDHLNHNKRDNRIQNLEWVTKEENLRRSREDYVVVDPMGPANLKPPPVRQLHVRLNGVSLPLDDALLFFSSKNRENAKRKITKTLSDKKQRNYEGIAISV